MLTLLASAIGTLYLLLVLAGAVWGLLGMLGVGISWFISLFQRNE